jgi:four helix bundle protein
MSNRIEDLGIYQLSEISADEIWNILCSWEHFARDTVGKQIVRSADSIGANIAEGFGRFYKENKNFCYFSQGSIIETKGWLKRSVNRSLISNEQYTGLLNQLETIHFKLNIYIKAIGKKSTAHNNDLMTRSK